ncbi:hypothetical protein F5Y05DRAFT_228274 [Hypoxylon sp. FL0543]|nr:hypothetical protein F5Y05DRAFT_228274 [Hypoxylon sp. FL0543]
MPPKRARSKRQSAAGAASRKRKAAGTSDEGRQPKRQKNDSGSSGNSSDDPAGSPSQDPTGPPSKGKGRIRVATNGLDQSLPPISNVDEAFLDIVDRSKGLLIDGSGRLHLRVATLCSGTEAPIWALKMLVEFFERAQPGRRFLNLSHVFSAEITPFKQAYIARNAPGAILFNDVRDFIEPENANAPTAMGAMQAIPGDIDILVAGCSCVDFSSLNTRKIKGYAQRDLKFIQDIKKNGYRENDFDRVDNIFTKIIAELEKLGESGQTFYSMLSYVREYRPKVVILENVSGAPWDEATMVWFPFIGYTASHIKLDTKDYYIPHTRVRGYLVALDEEVFGSDAAKAITMQWTEILKARHPRRASAPVCDWLLPPAHPLTERARQDDSEKALGPAVDSEWERSRSIHTRVRKSEGLGDERPITMWDVKDGQPYDRMDRGMIRSNPRRVLDCIDIIHLRSVKKGISIGGVTYLYDSRFKCRIFDVSQNIDRSIGGPPFGIAGCITPSGIHWMPDQSRLLTGFEALKLQGLPLHYLEFATETQDQLRDLAGNAMSTTVLGAVFVSLFKAMQAQAQGGNLNEYFPHALPLAKEEEERAVSENHLRSCLNFSTRNTDTVSKADIVGLFRRSRRYCFCNGSAKYSTSDFLECTICATIRCKWCKGNPRHNFVPTERPADFLLLSEVEQEVMRYLPSTISGLTTGWNPTSTDSTTSGLSIAHDINILEKFWSTTFYYSTTHVTEAVVVCYTGLDGFELRAKLSEKGITWYLYLDPWSKLGKKFREQLDSTEEGLGEKYTQLTQPIAKAEIFGAAGNVLPGTHDWQLWCFRTIEVELDIEAHDGTVGINSISHQLPLELQQDMREVCGVYRYCPDCDVPSDSLHVLDEKKIYLFKDARKTTTPDKDCYVISEECRALESHEYREVVLKFAPAVDVAKLDTGRYSAYIDGYWDLPGVSHSRKSPKIPAQVAFEDELKLLLPSKITVRKADAGQHVLAEAHMRRDKAGDRYNLIKKYEFQCGDNDRWMDGKTSHTSVDAETNCRWITVEKTDLHHLRDFISHINVKLASLKGLEVVFEIDKIEDWLEGLSRWRATGRPEGCPYGQLPPVKWIKVGGKYKPHSLSDAMAEFEANKRSRVPIFELRVDVPTRTDSTHELYVQYMVHNTALGERAAAYLPPTPDENARVRAFVQVQRHAVLSQNMQIDSKGADKHKFQPFRRAIKSLEGLLPVASPRGLIHFSVQLSDLQLLTLGWMLSKENGNPEFTEEEFDEEIVPDLKLRIVGRAQRTIHNRGGILADDVGYGKTVVMLALMHCQRFQDPKSEGMRLRATLVVVPPHLVSQWKSEARLMMPLADRDVVTIKSASDLKDDETWKVMDRLRRAKIIIVSNKVFADASYHLRLAQLAGSLDPPIVAPDNLPDFSSRAFRDWYKDAVPSAREHMSSLPEMIDWEVFNDDDLEDLWDKIEARRKDKVEEYRKFAEDFRLWKRQGGTVECKPRATQDFEWEVDIYPRPACGEDRAVKFMHVLEAFEFPRAVYDEFSYENPSAALFFSGLNAGAKWILSATPPTRNLAAVQGIGDLLNVHVARPIFSRKGLPTITEGPLLAEPSNAEALEGKKLYSDQCVRERHDKGVQFLEAFASSNPLDSNLAGSVKISEKVIVSDLTQSELIYYKDLEADLRACGVDVYRMPRDSRTLTKNLIDLEQWEGNGKTAAMVILLALSSYGNFNRDEEDRDPKLLHKQRQFQAESAVKMFQACAAKAVWLATRVINDQEEASYENALAAISDISMILREICCREYQACGGYDAWRHMVEAIINPEPREILDEKIDYLRGLCANDDLHGEGNKSFLEELRELTETTWHHYFNLEPSDVEQMEEEEASLLLRDLTRVEGELHPRHVGSTSKETLMALVTDEKNGLARYRRDVEPSPIPSRKYDENEFTTKSRCIAICKSIGILCDPTDTRQVIVDLLLAHNAGTLDEEMYASYNNNRVLKPGRYPTLGKTVRIRGGKYTCTRSDTSDASIQLRAAAEHLIYALKQERVTRVLTFPGRPSRKCNGCAKMKQHTFVSFVCECGHLLCRDHLDSKYCCGNEYELVLQDSCPTLLDKNNIMKLSDIHKARRRLDPSAAEKRAPSSRISSKSQMIANTIRSVPDDDYVLLFVQFDPQIEELKYTLEKNKIGYTTATEGDHRLYRPGNLSTTKEHVLKEMCLERGCLPEGAEDETIGRDELVERIEDWESKHKSASHAKVRILKLNDPTSAGTNLQYANHVMYACPLLTNLQEQYDAFMKQARGRCVRFGQKKTVQVYHFVTANTVEVDILELRRRCHVLVPPGQAVGRLAPASPNGDIEMDDEDAVPGEVRVNSSLTTAEMWKAMSEANWLNTVGMEH